MHLVHEVGLAKLLNTDVDRQGQILHAGLACPVHQLRTCCAQHPGAQRQYQASLFCQWYELIGRHQAQLGVAPAAQNFCAQDGPLRCHLRLVGQKEFAA